LGGVLELVHELVGIELGEAVDERGAQDDRVGRSSGNRRQRRQPVAVREPRQHRGLEEEALRAEPVEDHVGDEPVLHRAATFGIAAGTVRPRGMDPDHPPLVQLA
jgi:hypothetical protein